jgi:Serine phosphatase RsbU, regulator of sigma subunit
MMANLQAVAHAHVGASPDGSAQPPALFVQRLNEAFVGRFGNNRYATLFWAEYNAQTRILKYVNAGHEPPILIRPPAKSKDWRRVASRSECSGE